MEWGAGRASGASGISPRAHLKRPRHHRRRCRADQRADGVLELSDNDDDEEDEEGSDSESDSDSEDSGYEAIRDRHPGAFSPALPLFVRRRGLIVVGSTSWTPDDDYSILIEALHRLDFRLCQQEQQQQHAGLYGPSPLMPSSASSSAAAAREAEGHSPVRSPTLLHQTSGRFLSPGGGGGAGRTPFFSHRRPRPLDVWVLITGKGPGRARFEAQIKAAGLSSHVVVSTVYLQSYLQYSITLGAADVGLCLHQSSSGLDLPMKAVDMLGAGLPVIALDYEAIPELLGERLPATIGTLGCPPQSVSPHKDKITGSSRESYHHHHHHHHHQSRQTPPVVSLSALFTDSNSEVAAGMMEGEVITTPKRGHGVGLSSDMATQSLLLEPTPLSAPNDTVPSTLFDSLKAYTYGWTFQTSRDLEELLAAFIGYHNESYWQASETVPTAATGFARLSSFHSSLPTSPTSQPSSSGAAAQPFLRPPPPPLARFPFGSSQNYLLSGVMDPYPPGSSSSPLPGGDLSAGGLPRMLMEVRQRVCERRARGQEQKKREDGMPSLTCDAHPPTAAATSSSFHERQAHHAATWEDQWNAVVDPILKELL